MDFLVARFDGLVGTIAGRQIERGEEEVGRVCACSKSDGLKWMRYSLQIANFLDAIEHAIREVHEELADQDH